MANKNLYNKLAKEKRIAERYNVSRNELIISKSEVFTKIVSLIACFFSKTIKMITYFILVLLCSLGATFLINNILKIKEGL